MRDGTYSFANRAKVFADVLEDVDDPRIAVAAKEVLDGNVARGKDSWAHTKGYLKLVALKGGSEGEQAILSAIHGENPALAMQAADAIAHLQNPAMASGLLNDLGSMPDALSARVVSSLISCDSPAILHRIRDEVFSGSGSDWWRSDVMHRYLQGTTAGLLEEALDRYFIVDDPRERALLLSSCSGALGNCRADKVHVAGRCLDMIQDSLSSSDTDLALTCLSLIGDHQELQSEALLSQLEPLRSVLPEDAHYSLDRVLRLIQNN